MKRFLMTTFALLLLLNLGCPAIAQDPGTAGDEAKPVVPATTDPEAEKDDEESKAEPEIEPLTIGSRAPSLDVEHWVQDGSGQFGVVTDFEPNKVYVVEFWATWCGPCLSSMPHIAELQSKYADRGVQVISISNEDLETVEKFLERTVRGSREGEDPATYRDLTSGYCLTTDPDGSSSDDYMRAAKQNGIPCAFIVGKQGQVEWIGHPMAMDDALNQIVSDQWDRDAFRVEYIAQQEAQELMSRISRAMRSGATEQALELLDDYIANGKLEKAKNQFKQLKFRILVSDKDLASTAADYAIELMKDDSHDASSANNLAWQIYQLQAAQQLEDERVTKAALKFARSKVDEAGEIKPYLLDTVAHLQHVLGNSKQALKIQRRAMKAATPEQQSRLEGFLKELEELVEPDSKDDVEQPAAAAADATSDAADESRDDSASDEPQ